MTEGSSATEARRKMIFSMITSLFLNKGLQTKFVCESSAPISAFYTQSPMSRALANTHFIIMSFRVLGN